MVDSSSEKQAGILTVAPRFPNRVAKGVANTLGLPVYWLRQSAQEIQAMLVRIWAVLPIQKRRISRLLRAERVQLNFGCGETCYDGWIGVDRFFAKQVQITVDLRRSLPLPAQSVDLCYSEHFLEHLTPEEGQRHLSEAFRVLKPNGRYRVVVPDVMKFAEAYLNGDKDFFRLAFPWAERPMQAFYCVANWNGEHRNILDLSELCHMGRLAGFAAVQRSQANQSDIAELRIDTSDPQRVAESLYVEFIRETGETGATPSR